MKNSVVLNSGKVPRRWSRTRVMTCEPRDTADTQTLARSLGNGLALCNGANAAFVQALPTRSPPASNIAQTQRRQQQCEQAEVRRIKQRPDMRVLAGVPAPLTKLPTNESPCFARDPMELVGKALKPFDWLLHDLVTHGAPIAVGRAQDALVGKGESSANTLPVKAADTWTQRGLSDGVNVRTNASTVNNRGAGRTGCGAVSSVAWAQFDLGVSSVNKKNGPVVFGVSDVAIGGRLDTNHRATDFAQAVNNAGRTVELQGRQSINAALINNPIPNLPCKVRCAPVVAGENHITGSVVVSAPTGVGWSMQVT